MPGFFRKLDPRVTGELKAQKKPITWGLLCVLATSLLTSAMIPLVQQSIAAIVDTTPASASRELGSTPLPGLGSQPKLTDQQAEAMARELGVEKARVEEAVRRAADSQTDFSLPARKSALERLGVLCLLIVALFLTKYWFTRGQAYFLTHAASDLSANLRKRIFEKLQRLPLSYFHAKRSGSIQSVLTNDVLVFQNSVQIVRDTLDGPVKAVSAFAMIVWIQWQLALISLGVLPIMAYVIYRNGRRMKAAQAQVQENLAELSAFSNEAVLGIKVVKAFSAEDRVAGAFNERIRDTLKSQLRAARRFASLRPMVELIGASALALVIYICGHLAFRGAVHVADIAAIIFALDVVNQGFRSIGNVNNTYNQVQAATDRIYREVLDVPEEHEPEGAQSLPEPTRGQVTFERVSFSYPGGEPVLKDVSFEIPAGESLALVGASGAGKSTVADLLLRFYDPSEGHVKVDGVDVQTLSRSWLRSQMAVVPQHTFLFAGSIAANIRLGKSNATDEEVRRAAKEAHVTPFVDPLPKGFEETVGERGVRLSGGEIQRIAIARALVRQPKVLILDEATSNLDSESERAVQSALQDVMHGRTTLIIAHRLSTAARADRILVLRKGEVVEQGSHSGLLSQGGVYASMYRTYSSGVIDEPL